MRRPRKSGLKLPLTACRQLLLQILDLVAKPRVTVELLVDLADRMQHRRMIAVAEAAANLGQRSRGQLLGEIHTDLARPDHRPMPALGQEVCL